jgi:hypothetical protein
MTTTKILRDIYQPYIAPSNIGSPRPAMVDEAHRFETDVARQSHINIPASHLDISNRWVDGGYNGRVYSAPDRNEWKQWEDWNKQLSQKTTSQDRNLLSALHGMRVY